MSDLLLEREQELAAIDRAIRLAHAGCGRRLIISGPPGGGRTALLERARACAAERGLKVLTVGGEEREREFPFGLARRLLDAPEPRTRRYDALLELTGRLAAAAPAVVAVDDLQWSDPESADWLAFAARRLETTGIALVTAADTGEFESGDAITLEPAPLSEDAVEALLHVVLGHAVDAGFVRACHRATGGRPLLLHDLAAAARRARVRPTAAAVGWVERVVPPGAARLLARRLGPLPESARALGQAIAVLDDTASLHGAAALAELGPREAAMASDQLRRAGLLGGKSRPCITPPMLSRALYRSIPPGERALLHAHAARGARRGAAAVHHLLRSEPAADAWAVATLRRAAAQALQRGRPGEAAKLLRRAVLEGEMVEDRELLVTLAEAEHRLADPGEIPRLEAALEHGADVTGALARALIMHGRAGEALELHGADVAELYAGARLLPGAGAATAARLAAAAEDTPALQACRAAEAVCAATDAETAMALAGRALGAGLDPEAPVHALACSVLAWCDQHASARESLERALAHARRLCSVPGLVRTESALAGIAVSTGDLDAALQPATTALGAGRHTAPAGQARAALVLALVELDRLDDADRACDVSTPELRYARGRVRLARCDRAGALEDFLAAGDALVRDAICGPALIPWRSAAALALGEGSEATALAAEEHALAARFGAPGALGRALRALAAVGPTDERAERCRDAVAVLGSSQARLEHAHALCDLGAVLRRKRARRAAREPLRQALDLAVRCGAVALARRAREELAAAGARPRRFLISGRDALTPAELRVAQLAARGLANREIALTLFVTVKTVETELGHAYAKLGIRSRRDLPGALGT